LFGALAGGISQGLFTDFLRWWDGAVDVVPTHSIRTLQRMPSVQICPMRIDPKKPSRVPFLSRLEVAPDAAPAIKVEASLDVSGVPGNNCSTDNPGDLEALGMRHETCVEEQLSMYPVPTPHHRYEVQDEARTRCMMINALATPQPHDDGPCVCVWMYNNSVAQYVQVGTAGRNNSLYIDTDLPSKFSVVAYQVMFFYIDKALDAAAEYYLPSGQDHLMQLVGAEETEYKDDSASSLLEYHSHVSSFPRLCVGHDCPHQGMSLTVYFTSTGFQVMKTETFNDVWTLPAMFATTVAALAVLNKMSLYNAVFPEWIDGKRYFAMSKPRLNDEVVKSLLKSIPLESDHAVRFESDGVTLGSDHGVPLKSNQEDYQSVLQHA